MTFTKKFQKSLQPWHSKFRHCILNLECHGCSPCCIQLQNEKQLVVFLLQWIILLDQLTTLPFTFIHIQEYDRIRSKKKWRGNGWLDNLIFKIVISFRSKSTKVTCVQNENPLNFRQQMHIPKYYKTGSLWTKIKIKIISWLSITKLSLKRSPKNCIFEG